MNLLMKVKDLSIFPLHHNDKNLPFSLKTKTSQEVFFVLDDEGKVI